MRKPGTHEPPKDGDFLEKIVGRILQERYDPDSVVDSSKSGCREHGIDFYITNPSQSKHSHIGVQCTADKEFGKREAKEYLSSTEGLDFELGKYVFYLGVNADVEVAETIADLQGEYDIEIKIWTWSKISGWLFQNNDILREFYPIHTTESEDRDSVGQTWNNFSNMRDRLIYRVREIRDRYSEEVSSLIVMIKSFEEGLGISVEVNSTDYWKVLEIVDEIHFDLYFEGYNVIMRTEKLQYGRDTDSIIEERDRIYGGGLTAMPTEVGTPKEPELGPGEFSKIKKIH